MSKKELKAKLKALKVQAGLDRKTFFAEGGELSRWRGIHQVVPDKKKAKNKKACRGKPKIP